MLNNTIENIYKRFAKNIILLWDLLKSEYGHRKSSDSCASIFPPAKTMGVVGFVNQPGMGWFWSYINFFRTGIVDLFFNQRSGFILAVWQIMEIFTV
jgi:hypothetical protein